MSPTECHRTRRELTARESAAVRLSTTAERHLEQCAECAALASRFEAVIDVLRDHRTAVLPDAGFAGRVTAALPGRPSQPSRALGWAAARLAPVGLALALSLGVWCWLATSPPAELFEATQDEDLLTWLLIDEETAP